jgi:translation initiation factor 2 subunit 3
MKLKKINNKINISSMSFNVLNIGLIGHVSHGKSTLVKSITGVTTSKFKKEKQRNMTIKLGYANVEVCESLYTKCIELKVAESDEWRSIKRISFVDCPGHKAYMSAMLNGVSIMDMAILLISANVPCPQPQTIEHLAAMEVAGIDNIIVIQNKCDLVNRDDALKNYQEIKEFLKNTFASDAQIIPISAQLGYNIDIVCDLLKSFNSPTRSPLSQPFMLLVRTFDVNKPGTTIENMVGGIIGGSLIQGCLNLGDNVVITPGIVTTNDDGTFSYKPLKARVESICTENIDINKATPGGLFGVGLNLDPSYTKADRLVGNILTFEENVPQVTNVIDLFFLEFTTPIKRFSNDNINEGEVYMFSIHSTTVQGTVVSKEPNMKIRVCLAKPICVCENISKIRIAVSKNIDNDWVLIGYCKMSDQIENSLFHVGDSVTENYTTMLDNIYNRDKNITKVKILKPIVENVNIKTIWKNYKKCVDHINRELDHVMNFVAEELDTPCSIDQLDQLIVHRKYTPKNIENIWKKYIMTFVQCQICKSKHTEVVKDTTRLLYKQCLDCNSKIILS